MAIPSRNPLAQAGAIPYRYRDGELEVLLITSRRRNRWVIPKGIIDPGYDAATTAAKETMEEAGVAGRLSKRPIGTYTYFKWERVLEVRVFLMEVTQERSAWEEASYRQRRWYRPEEAAALVEEGDLKALLVAVPLAIAELM